MIFECQPHLGVCSSVTVMSTKIMNCEMQVFIIYCVACEFSEADRLEIKIEKYIGNHRYDSSSSFWRSRTSRLWHWLTPVSRLLRVWWRGPFDNLRWTLSGRSTSTTSGDANLKRLLQIRWYQAISGCIQWLLAPARFGVFFLIPTASATRFQRDILASSNYFSRSESFPSDILQILLYLLNYWLQYWFSDSKFLLICSLQIL